MPMYRYNIEELRRAVLNGPEVHPGASIVRAETHQFLLQFADRTRVAANLKVNFYVLYMWVLRCNLDFQDRKSACYDIILFICPYIHAPLMRTNYVVTYRSAMWSSVICVTGTSYYSTASRLCTRCPSWRTRSR